ncbi:MAG: anti-sigma factor antagonist [Candidatus Improbicoccus pseudotrichonymphae]|uniref:Anti-sigma factor antagonist n=1 Tax=Candidatus Improbicoccus pseudotrichonymphae TaxID=3033792 RepID=A0AA48I0J8_9FIRM|nr:MAG: anti-sigma factor antagonist [Candidatus Improbicoccus pseudotrichonymphae]
MDKFIPRGCHDNKGKVNLNYDGIDLVAMLSGDIDHHSTQEIKTYIDDEIIKRNPSCLVIDFKNVRFMDSSGIGLVLGRYKKLGYKNSRIRIINIPERLYRIFKISGLKVLGIL